MLAKQTYVQRRKTLMNSLQSGIILLLGNSEAPANYPDNAYPFRQDSSFLYYTGLDSPDLALMIDIDQQVVTLFGNEPSLDDIIWMGPQPSLGQRAEQTGIHLTLPLERLSTLLDTRRPLHYLQPYRSYNRLWLSELLGQNERKTTSGYSLPLTHAIIQMRLIKSDEELVELADAGAIGYDMHIAAMKMCRPGVSEQEIAGIIEGIALSRGKRVAFPTILSMNGQTLHNHDHSGILAAKRLMLCDAGAENNNHYASDFTRTTAVGGRYTQQQIDIHNIVLRALNHSIAAAKPGVSYQTVHQEAYRIIFEDLRDLGLTSGNPDEALEDGAPALFMPHGLGHAMGLDVHDMENLGETFVGYGSAIQRDTRFGYRSLRFGRVLEPGHVITVEPGIYFIPELIHKWEKAHRKSPFINYKEVKKYLPVGGIRLEDNIVITPTGNRFVYERRLPVTIDEIRETVEEDRNPRSRHRPGVV